MDGGALFSSSDLLERFPQNIKNIKRTIPVSTGASTGVSTSLLDSTTPWALLFSPATPSPRALSFANVNFGLLGSGAGM